MNMLKLTKKDEELLSDLELKIFENLQVKNLEVIDMMRWRAKISKEQYLHFNTIYHFANCEYEMISYHYENIETLLVDGVYYVFNEDIKFIREKSIKFESL